MAKNLLKLVRGRWDGQLVVQLTPEFVDAIHALGVAYLAQMRQQKRELFSPDDWEWIEITILDLSQGCCLQIIAGSEADRDEDSPAGVSVWIELAPDNRLRLDNLATLSPLEQKKVALYFQLRQAAPC